MSIIGQHPAGQIILAVMVGVPYLGVRLVDGATGRHLQNGWWRFANWFHRRSQYIIPAFFAGLTLFFILGSVYLWAAIVGLWYAATWGKARVGSLFYDRKMKRLAADPDKFALPWDIEEQADNVDGRDWVDVVGIDATRSIGFFGSPGSGKTETIKHILYQMCLTPADQPIVILDLKNEFQEILEDWGVPYTNVSGAETTDVNANIFAEARPEKAEADLEELSRSLFPSSMSGDFFETGARQVFTAVLKHLHRQGRNANIHPDHSDIVNYFQSSTREDCYEDLEQYDDMAAALSLIDPEADKQSAGVFASLQQNVEQIFRASFRKGGDFSIREYIQNPQDDGVVVLDFPADLSDSVMPMYRVLLDWGIKHGRIDDKHVNYLMDEFAQVPHLRQIGELLNMGRGENATAILALQSIGQLNENYSSDTTDALASGLATKVILGLSDPATADFALDLIGEEWGEQEKAKRGFDGDITGTRTEEVPERPFVSSELQSWDRGVGVILPPGGSYIHGRNQLISRSHTSLWEAGMGRSVTDRRQDDSAVSGSLPPIEDADDGSATAAANGGNWEPDARGNRDIGDNDD